MRKSHLEFDSLEDWADAGNVPANFFTVEDEQLRDKYINEYGELRRHLFAKHATTLSDVDQQKLNKGQHPSQSHDFAADAEPYCELLETHLRTLGIEPVEVTLGWYHMDRIVLNVTLENSEARSGNKRPWLFQGFEIFYVGEKSRNAT